MKNYKFNKKFEKLVTTEVPRLSNVMYVPYRLGYLLFEKFYLRAVDSVWYVDYQQVTREFYSAAIAIAWCISKNSCDEATARSIEKQAALYTHYSGEIQYYKKMISSISNPYSDKTGIIEAKLSDSIYYATQARAELNKCLKIAKYKQTIGFNNEIRRSVPSKLGQRHK